MTSSIVFPSTFQVPSLPSLTELITVQLLVFILQVSRDLRPCTSALYPGPSPVPDLCRCGLFGERRQYQIMEHPHIQQVPSYVSELDPFCSHCLQCSPLHLTFHSSRLGSGVSSSRKPSLTYPLASGLCHVLLSHYL